MFVLLVFQIQVNVTGFISTFCGSFASALLFLHSDIVFIVVGLGVYSLLARFIFLLGDFLEFDIRHFLPMLIRRTPLQLDLLLGLLLHLVGILLIIQR